MSIASKSACLCATALVALAVATVPASAKTSPRHHRLVSHAVDPATFVATYEPPPPKMMIMIGVGY